jgi:hypothetical protein
MEGLADPGVFASLILPWIKLSGINGAPTALLRSTTRILQPHFRESATTSRSGGMRMPLEGAGATSAGGH